jgi:cysteinyl-tRNA synthetase
VSLRVYDTMAREKREFAPVRPGKAGMYVCGMTVQDRPHVGHIRSSIAGDLIRRYLEWTGYEVTSVYNFTDVDDKIIARAQQEGLEFHDVSERNIQAFLRVAALHNVLPATHYPRATRHIAEILALIERLVEKGYAYAADGDVYFEVRRKPDYGKLSGRNVDEMRAGARIEVGEHKRDPLDFALWKGAKPGEPAWESPWGPGRPGWHIECSAMSMKYLGETFDLHGGGQDLIFPHHENEIAQSEAATGRPFANYWVENGMVNLGGEKMSKSTKNLFYAEDIAAGADPEVVRFYLLSTHYRSPIDFTNERLAEAGTAYARLRGPLERAGAWSGESAPAPHGAMAEAAGVAERSFREAMDDDFNSARAMGHLFDLSREVNRALEAGDRPQALAGARVLKRLGEVLGLFWVPPGREPQWEPEVMELVSRREQARKSRDFKGADELRRALLDRGVMVEDSPAGPRLRRRS